MSKKNLPKQPRYIVERNRRIKLYSKLVKSTRKALKEQGLDLSYYEARKYTSQYVYPVFKGQAPSSVTVADVSQIAQTQLGLYVSQQTVSDNIVDPRLISEDEATAINFFNIDDFLTGYASGDLRAAYAMRGDKDIRLDVISINGERTGEFLLSEYDYVGSGVQSIVENIRKEYGNGSDTPQWEGYVGKRFGQDNPASKNSYVLQLILTVDGNPVVNPDTVSSYQPSKQIQTPEDFESARSQQAERLREEREKRLAGERAKKMKARKMTSRPKTKEQVKETRKKDKDKVSKAETVLEINKSKERELKALRRDYDDGIYDKNEYKKERERIMSYYEQAIKKLKRGGIV